MVNLHFRQISFWKVSDCLEGTSTLSKHSTGSVWSQSTYYIAQVPPWQTNRRFGSQQIILCLCNANVHYCPQRNLLPDPTRSQKNLIHIPVIYLCKIYFNIIPGLPTALLPSDFPTSCAFIIASHSNSYNFIHFQQFSLVHLSIQMICRNSSRKRRCV
jgi:hypothetical protein